ncbi:MAG: thioredoxin [Pelotomaculaceae bacterium]|uniref:Thioredoxin n=1 Tax=anaerobic digester metagenome TaxID=1263854 RepID=A0A485LXJ4_9ZZZZ|nr:thioredoxin [Bacillota bacterium]HHU86592.1 thioredoxin [Peptococcaceae bacterium]
MASEKIMILNESNFNQVISETTIPILVDFWAEWCGPCKMIGPVVEEIASEFEGKVQVAKLDVDENQNTASNYKVVSIPTLILFKEGKEMERSIGYKNKDELRRLLNKYL